MKSLNTLSYVLVVIGAINWGLMGAFNLNLVEMILGSAPALETLVYILVGLAGLYELANFQKRV